MNESFEREQSSRRIVESSLARLFDDLKEHMVSLRPEDYDMLSRRFSGEVTDYVGDLLKRIEARRVARKRQLETK